jgi:hypothetical protein
MAGEDGSGAVVRRVIPIIVPAAWFKRCCSRVTPKIDGAVLAKTFRDSTVTLV